MATLGEEVMEHIRQTGIRHGIADYQERGAVRHTAMSDVLCSLPEESRAVLQTYEQGYAQGYQPWRWLVVKANCPDDYYGFGTFLAGRGAGGVQILCTPVTHATWQAGRLASGLELLSPDGGFATEEAALDYAAKFDRLLHPEEYQ